jgi:ABC-2 type transport system permease protein
MMTRTWLIARHHFLEQVRKRSFLFILFSLPLILGLSVGMGILFERASRSTATIGYVDPSGFLADVALMDDAETLELRSFPTGAAAQNALDAEEIDAYYLLDNAFGSTRKAELIYYEEAPSGDVQGAFIMLIRRNHLTGLESQVVERALSGADVTVTVRSTGREFGANPTVEDFLPLLAALMIGFLAMTSSGYMMSVVVEEKESRTMEIVVSSVSVGQLMTGKIFGALGIALAQLLVWIGCLVGGILIGQAAGVPWMADIQPRWHDLVQIAVVALPVYAFLTAAFTAIGATLTETYDAEQIGPVTLLLVILPVYFMGALSKDPGGTVAMALSLFPPTAVTTLGLRMLMTALPWWQVLVSAAIALTSALFMIWLAAKALRMGMLRYGQRLSLRELLRGRARHLPAPAETFTGGGHA